MKTDTFFLIHNYNTIPEELLTCCSDYLIMDASDDRSVSQALDELGLNMVHVQNTGHNLTSYFSWMADQVSAEESRKAGLSRGEQPGSTDGTTLTSDAAPACPEVVCLCKGNMIGRHCSREYFDRVCGNTWFTYLYEEYAMRPRYSKATKEVLEENHGRDPSEGSIAALVTESCYLEENNSWYAETGTHPYRYFRRYDDLLTFVYRDPVIPKQVMFSPGGCYIVRREQFLRHSAAFYRNLNRIMDYTLDPAFPAEAYMVERMMPVIFESSYEVNPWMDDEKLFEEKLAECEENVKRELEEQRSCSRSVIGRLRRIAGRLAGRQG